jgi:RNase H-like domain found in reverse transcriptase
LEDSNLAQKNEHGKIQIISHASRQLKENENNYTKFLLETAAAAWGMDNFNEYLNRSKFTLYKDTTTEAMLGTTQLKTSYKLATNNAERSRLRSQGRTKIGFARLPEKEAKPGIATMTKTKPSTKPFMST